MTEIPYGYCHCGCGQKTNLARRTDRKRGYVRGEPYRLYGRHQAPKTGAASPMWKGGRTRQNGYVKLYLPEHPRANAKGYVFEHIVVAERALGKPLPTGAVVHHVNEQRADNRGRNLVICPDNAYHQLIHRRLRAFRACGNANGIKCTVCKGYADPSSEAFYTLPNGIEGYHHACRMPHAARRAAQEAHAEEGTPCEK